MEKMLMGEVTKQIGIFLDACITNDERSDFVKDESLNNLKKLFNDPKFNSALDSLKNDFNKKLIDTTELLQQYQEAERNNIEAYTEFIDLIKTLIISYLKNLRLT